MCWQGGQIFALGRGGRWSPIAGPPPQKKRGAPMTGPQNQPKNIPLFYEGVSRARRERAGRGQGIGRGGGHLLTVRVHLGQTLTLIKTEYWDRAGGVGNISYGW